MEEELMKKIKLNKGITIISLIVTIVLMLILTTVIVTDTDTGSDYKKYKLIWADIELLEDKVLIYYNKYGEIPTKQESITEDLPENISETNEKTRFSYLDVNKLSNITLNYGDAEDIFIIDNTTLEVYYLNGIEYEGEIYYTD